MANGSHDQLYWLVLGEIISSSWVNLYLLPFEFLTLKNKLLTCVLVFIGEINPTKIAISK